MDRFDNFAGEAAEGPIVIHDTIRDMAPQSQQDTRIQTEDTTKTTRMGNGTVTVGFDYLKRLEDMITGLQSWGGPPPPPPFSPGLRRRGGPPPPQPFQPGLRRWAGGSPPPPDMIMIEDGDVPKAVEGEADGETNGEKKLEIIRLREIYAFHGETDPLREPDRDLGPGHTVTEGTKHTLTVVRVFDTGYRFWKKKLEIVSPILIDSLAHVSNYGTDVERVDGGLHLYEPFMVLFHNRQQLRILAEDTSNSTPAKEPAKLILDFMQHEFADIGQKLDDVESANPSGSITFPDIWMLYPPGTIVYSIENGEREAFVVDSIRGVQKRRPSFVGRSSHTRLDITCWSINYDGEIYGRVWSTHCILPFHGTKDISALELVPEKYLPEAESVKSALLARGEQFWSLQGQKYLEYTGEMYTQQASDDEAVRVMVDHLSYQRRNHWPITIDRKQGPSAAQSKNWRSNRFPRRNRHGRRRSSSSSRSYREGYQPAHVEDPDEVSNVGPDRIFKNIQPPTRDNSEFNKYDSLQPDTRPDELTLLLCPQQVHGYSLRDKAWSKYTIILISGAVINQTRATECDPIKTGLLPQECVGPSSLRR